MLWGHHGMVGGVVVLHPSGCTWSEEKEGGTQVPLGGGLRLESGQSVTAMAFLSLPIWPGEPSGISLPVLFPSPRCLCLI